jgi:hypothetical protein
LSQIVPVGAVFLSLNENGHRLPVELLAMGAVPVLSLTFRPMEFLVLSTPFAPAKTPVVLTL